MSRAVRNTPPVHTTKGSPPAGDTLAPLIVAVTAAALHAATLGYGFVWDDARLIVTNAGLRSWGGLREALLSDFWITSGPAASGFWRPLVTFSYAVDRVWGGGSAWAFHACNVVAHALVSALTVVFARRLGAGRFAALVAGLWFATMPVHVESVAWISGRTDLLCALFALVALVLDRRDRDADRASPGVPALLAGFLALLAKEAAALLPLFVMVLERGDVRPGRRGGVRWLVPWCVLVAAWAVAHVAFVPPVPPPPYLDAETLSIGRRASLLALPGYLGFLWPFSTHTPATLLAAPRSWWDARVLLGAALHGTLLVALIVAWRRRSPWAVAIGMFWGSLLPAIAANLMQAYLLYSERFLYLPSVGAAWALALLVETSGRSRLARAAVVTAAAVGIATSGWVTARTLPDWRSDESLFESMTRKGPRNAQGWTQLARLRFAQNREADALAALEQAETLAPGRPEVRSLRALLHFRRGEWHRVIAYADTALALDPTLPEPRLARATALVRMGRLEEADEELSLLRARLGENATVLGLEGQRLARLNRLEEALPLLQRASAEAADDADTHFALGMVLAQRGSLREARAAFERAVAADPSFGEAWMRLAVACHQLADAAAREAALERAAALPEAADGRVEWLRRRLGAGAEP